MKRRFFNRLLATIPFFGTVFFAKKIQADYNSDSLIKVPNQDQIYYNPKFLSCIEIDGTSIFFNPKHILFIDADSNNEVTTIHFANENNIVVKSNIENVMQLIWR